MGLPALTHHGQLVLWMQLLVIVGLAYTLGIVFRRLGQPQIIGQLIAGVLIGPSVLGHLWPAAERLLVPRDLAAAAPVNAIGWLGVFFLLILTGFDTDLARIRRMGRTAAAVAVGALVIPFAAGIALGWVMPTALRGQNGGEASFVLFIAVAMSISALPVIARILTELEMIRHDLGQLTIAIAMVIDLVGWLALGIVTALARTNDLTLGAALVPVAAVTVYVVASFTIGRRLLDALLRRVITPTSSTTDAVAVVALVALVFTVLAMVAGSDPVLGAYVAGVLLGRSSTLRESVHPQLESMTIVVLGPVFFALAGLRLDLTSLASSSGLLWAAVVLVVAVVAKVAGVFGGAAAIRLPRRQTLALAAGLNCRGAVEVVVATVGLTTGVLSTTAYSAIVVMAIVTTVMAPPLLRAIVPQHTRQEPVPV